MNITLLLKQRLRFIGNPSSLTHQPTYLTPTFLFLIAAGRLEMFDQQKHVHHISFTCCALALGPSISQVVATRPYGLA